MSALLAGADIERYDSAVAKAVNWLREHHRQVIELPDVSSHYKGPYLYATTGGRTRARRHLDLIIDRYLQEDGDFRTSPDDPGWPQEPASPANRYLYSDSWLVLGLQRMGLYGAAAKGLQFLRRFQDPDLGGFRSTFDVKTRQVNVQYLNVPSTCIAGLALLACGQAADATRAGEFVLHVLAAQPKPDRHLFVSWDMDQGLMTDVFGDEDPGAVRGRKQFCVNAEADASGEFTWMIGIAMTFLCKVFDLTREQRFLDGAKSLFDFFHRMDEARWENLASCKIMWGGAELYRITGNREHGETAKRILDHFCRTQHEAGPWVHTIWFKSIDEQPFGATTDIINELAGEICETVFNLSGA